MSEEDTVLAECDIASRDKRLPEFRGGVSFVLKGQTVGTNFQQSTCFPFNFCDFSSNVDKGLDLKTLSHWIYDSRRFEI
jgi:hypothetical protein